MKKNGFTLVELLAVISILSIIAVITIPKINKSLETSKISTVIVSAKGYIAAVDSYYINSKVDGQGITLNGVFAVNREGVLYDNTNVYEIKFTGGGLTNGILTYVNDDFNSGCLTINGYKVNIDSSRNATAEKGICEYDDIVNYTLYASDYLQEYLALALEKYSNLETETVYSVDDMDISTDVLTTDGWILFDVQNNEVIIKNYSLKFGDYVATITGLEQNGIMLSIPD